jgi:hypothetical protein
MPKIYAGDDAVPRGSSAVQILRGPTVKAVAGHSISRRSRSGRSGSFVESLAIGATAGVAVFVAPEGGED